MGGSVLRVERRRSEAKRLATIVAGARCDAAGCNAATQTVDPPARTPGLQRVCFRGGMGETTATSLL